MIKDRVMEYRTCLWNKELYVKHGDLQRPMQREALGGPSSAARLRLPQKKGAGRVAGAIE